MKILRLLVLISFSCLSACDKSGLSDTSGGTEESTSDESIYASEVSEALEIEATNTEIKTDSPTPPLKGTPVVPPIDLTQLGATSKFYSDNCPDGVQDSGFNYSFTNTSIIRSGADFWDNTCIAGTPQLEEYIASNLADESGVPFNCTGFPVCTSSDFNQTIVSSDGSQYTLTYDASINTLTAIKLNFLEGTVVTETIILNYL